MNFEEIVQLLKDKFSDDVITDIANAGIQPQAVIKKEKLKDICKELYSHPQLFFDTLSCLTALDNGPKEGTMEVIYNLYSIPFNHHFIIRVITDRQTPQVPSVTELWRTANWHEREAYDMYGINFEGHPDLRRILLPADWKGYPLQKDYEQQEEYHGIKVEY